MKIGIIQSLGSGAERETSLAVQRAGMEPIELLWGQDKTQLSTLDGYINVDGFSCDDPMMQEIAMQSEKGKPVLGIASGARMLVETGLVPGLENNKVGIRIAEDKQVANDGAYIRLAKHYQRNAFTRHLTSSQILSVTGARGESCFAIPEALLQEMIIHGLAVFQYCNEQGKIDEHSPINPAAVSNKNGNVMAILMHPERALNGDAIFKSMRDYILSGKFERLAPLSYYPRAAETLAKTLDIPSNKTHNSPPQFLCYALVSTKL